MPGRPRSPRTRVRRDAVQLRRDDRPAAQRQRDTEAIVRTGDGDFWHVDEYSPSIVLVDREGSDEYKAERVSPRDVLAQEVGVLGIFSDWAAPVTFYANCMNIK